MEHFDYRDIKNPLGTRLSGFIMFIENGTNGDRTRDLSRVRRTLIPAELWFQVLNYPTTAREICQSACLI